MHFIADFHIHSHHSIATSKDLVPEYLDYWARLKGIGVVGTGDITHPGWLGELEQKLEAAEPGLFRLKEECIQPEARIFSDRSPRFILTGEISNIYKRGGRVRKVHNLIFVPSFSAARALQARLEALGNIRSDGRPILGLDSRDLFEIVLDSSERAFLVPAHIWTPWFSVLGAKSGFDTIEECYGDLSEEIHALETGLSSDPPMNWMCSFLDRFTLISNSDAHSPEKLGREANIFDTDFSYDDIIGAMKSGDRRRFLGTIEFFPQEGKYHFDGHRKCGVRWDPVKTLLHGETCPVCGKKVTIGVMHRVAQRADREKLEEGGPRALYFSLIPLTELLSELMGCAPSTKKVSSVYHTVVQKAGSELDLLLHMPVEDISKLGVDLLAEGIRRVRNREVCVQEGFDGEFGKISVFPEGCGKLSTLQVSFLEDSGQVGVDERVIPSLRFDYGAYRRLREEKGVGVGSAGDDGPVSIRDVGGAAFRRAFESLNEEQRNAASHYKGPAIVVAGPGTGKTHTLTCRIARMILELGVQPEHILAFAFTNKAVGEMRERLREMLSGHHERQFPRISTFHSYGLTLLRDHCERFGRNKDFCILAEDERRELLIHRVGITRRELKGVCDALTNLKQVLHEDELRKNPSFDRIFRIYQEALKKENAFDLDDLVCLPLELLLGDEDLVQLLRARHRWICIDEYQDINHVQYRLVRALMPDSGANLYVIGDPNQAIYGFRGSDVRFLDSYLTDYPDATLYRLKESFRCSDVILRASHQVIEGKNQESLLRGISPGVAISVSSHPSDRSEAEFVARTIERMMGGVRFFSIDSHLTTGEEEGNITSLAEYAVLCRIGAQMKVMEKSFADHGIPYQLVGEDPFFHREPARTVIDLLRIVKNPANGYLASKYESRGILDAQLMKELFVMRDSGLDLRHGPMPQDAGVIHAVKDILRVIIDRVYGEKTVDEELALQRLVTLSEKYGESLEGFLSFAATGVGADAYIPDTEKVTLITIHASKGLEFGCVFIVGCEDGLIPYTMFQTQRADLQEERRLFYVGMTRARQALFLSHAQRRFLFGRELRLERSIFLDSIAEELVERERIEHGRKAKGKEGQLDLF